MSEWIFPGKVFAGQKALNGYEFRCGLFSADYMQIPTSVAKKYVSSSSNESIRKNIYLGIYLTQRLLESERYPRNEDWIDFEFKKIITSLSES